MTASSQTSGPMPPESPPAATPEQMREVFAAYGAVLPAPAGPESMPVQASAVGPVEASASGAGPAFQAEIERLRKQIDAQVRVLAASQDHARAVLRLCEGRRGDDLLLVAAVAAAVDTGTTPYDGLPMTLTWNRSADVPSAHDTHKRVVIECVSSYGGRADLVVEGDDRFALASLVDAEIRDVNAPCSTDDCGAVEDYDGSDPTLAGWARLEVAGTDDGPRWYCSPQCVSAALARAGDALALDDHVARCARCGCTEDSACEGGCAWVPNGQMTDLCSACATPEELSALAFKTVGDEDGVL